MFALLAALILQAPHDRIVEDAAKFLKSAPEGERAAVARELDRWFPNRASLKPFLAADSRAENCRQCPAAH